MQKMTLLEMVQNIASALETDEINSITDTTESLQIAEVIKETFYEQFNNIVIPEFRILFPLESVNDVASPNYLKLPDNVSKIYWIKYKNFRDQNSFMDVPYVDPETFLNLQLMFSNPDSSLTFVTDPESGVQYYVQNNSMPSMFTIFGDKYIAFNTYDAEAETTLQGSNSIGFGLKSFQFEMEDDFVPPLDANLFPLLLAEAKSVCFINLKQISSSKEEQRARRQRIRMQNDQFRSRTAQTDYWNRGPNFARWR